MTCPHCSSELARISEEDGSEYIVCPECGLKKVNQ